jgi:NAD-dependent SIR2 family protein deacetylase
MDLYAIGVCIECGNQQPAKYMEKTKFQQPSCRFCGGVVKEVAVPDDDEEAARRVKHAVEQANSKRGIYNKPSEDDEVDNSGLYG